MSEHVRHERRERVYTLAKEMNVGIDWSATNHYEIQAFRDHVVLMPCDTPREYIAALHELGHHVLGHAELGAGHPELKKHRLDAEAEAWRWAFARADEPLEAETFRHVEEMLGSYQRVAEKGARGYGPPGDTFWQVAREVRDAQR